MYIKKWLCSPSRFHHYFLIALSSAILLASGMPRLTEAASIYFSPSSNSYVVERTFTVNVNVSSIDQSMNAVQGVINFSPGELSVASISKSNSIINLWVQEPTYNNATGKINFEGVVLNPGFTGSSGRIIQITFKSKTEGTVNIEFASASVLANDGKGTNILTQLGSGQYLIEPQVIAPSLPTPASRFLISLVEGEETNNPQPKIKFTVENVPSAIDHYEIRVDQGSFVFWKSDGSNIYTVPSLGLGRHIITARAYYANDKFLESSIEITITALEIPEITAYDKILNKGDILVVRGKTHPDAVVNVYLQRDGENPSLYETKSDSAGDFIFVYDKPLDFGTYSFQMEVVNNQGAKSELTEKLTVVVQEPAIVRIGTSLISSLSIMITLLVLLIVLVTIFYRLKKLRQTLTHEVAESESALHVAFRALRKDIETQLDKLVRAQSKRDLTKEEQEIKKVLISHLNAAEMLIEKEILDIEKDLN